MYSRSKWSKGHRGKYSYSLQADLRFPRHVSISWDVTKLWSCVCCHRWAQNSMLTVHVWSWFYAGAGTLQKVPVEICILVSCSKAPNEIPWSEAGATYIVESTGVFLNVDKASVSIWTCPACSKMGSGLHLLVTPWDGEGEPSETCSSQCFPPGLACSITKLKTCPYSTGSFPRWGQASGGDCTIPRCSYVCYGSQSWEVRSCSYESCEVSRF